MASLRTWLAGWRLRKSGAAAEPAAGGATCRYLAIIMDGNGRWAQGRGLPVAAGHRAGAKALRRVLEHALDLGIREVTVYSFSTENWNRPRDEVEALTAGNTKMTLYIAFSYGGRRELLDAAQGLAAEYAASAFEGDVVAPDGGPEFSDEDLRRHLYAPDMHDPELLVRTSGELRISNFLLWQCAYSELYFSDRYWPDFGPEDLDAALADYAGRQRRFGGRRAAAPAADASGAAGAPPSASPAGDSDREDAS